MMITSEFADKLDAMFYTQWELQDKLNDNNISMKLLTTPSRQRYINMMTLALIDEALEMLRETDYKNRELVEFGWKDHKQENIENMQAELIDVFHFFLNLCIAAGLSPTILYDKYMAKNAENIKRMKEGY